MAAFNRNWVSFRGDENVLELDHGDGCPGSNYITVNVINATKLYNSNITGCFCKIKLYKTKCYVYKGVYLLDTL